MGTETLINHSYTKIVCVASSTGGPAALMNLLPSLPEDFPVPVVVVQHIWSGFTTPLAEDLDKKCVLPVCLAEEGMTVTPGKIYIAPTGKHLKIRKVPAHHIFELSDEGPRGGVRPSADVLFESLINSAYRQITAVVLTGMGTDATEGILKLSEKKKVDVIAQDEKTSVVFGMPGSIREKYPQCLVLPIDKIADELIYTMKP